MTKTVLKRDAAALAEYLKLLLDLDPATEAEKDVNLGRVLLVSAVYDRLIEWSRQARDNGECEEL